MSVLIKGMQMPKTCVGCDIGVGICDRIYDPKFTRYRSERHPDCPLVEVKEPHGDLIERDALLRGEGRYIIALGKEGIDVEEIKRAPMVIEAETCDSDSCPIHFPDEQPKYDPDEFFSAERSGK